MTPVRIQRRREKGWRMPAGAVYVGRPTAFGNPYRPEDYGSLAYRTAAGRRDMATWDFRQALTAAIERPWGPRPVDLPFRIVAERLFELRGRDLVCWCPLDQPCHADVLLELANAA